MKYASYKRFTFIFHTISKLRAHVRLFKLHPTGSFHVFLLLTNFVYTSSLISNLPFIYIFISHT